MMNDLFHTRKKACIFDLDGTLADTVASIAYSGNQTLAAFGYAPLPEKNYNYYAGDGAKELARRFLSAARAQSKLENSANGAPPARFSARWSEIREYGGAQKSGEQAQSEREERGAGASEKAQFLSDASQEWKRAQSIPDDDAEFVQVFRKYKEIFAEYCMYQVRPFDGIPELLSELRRRGIRTAVLSNKPHLQTIDVVERIFGKDCFDWVQGQQDGVPKKPAPDGALQIAARFGAKPEECIYSGDTNTDMQTGNAAGMLTLGVLWGFRDEQELLDNHAMALLKTPLEMLDYLG